MRQDVYEVLSSNEKPIKTTHVINDLDLEIDIKESVDNYDLKIKFKSNANELFSLNETNFSSDSKYKILAGNGYEIINEYGIIKIQNFNNYIRVNFELSEENKVTQTFSINLKVNVDNNNLDDFSKFEMGGEIYDGIVSSKYAELFKELNILSKDMDITLLSNELIKNKIESIKSDDGSIKFKDIKLIIGNGSNNEDNLSFIISGKYLGINIDETTIKISNLYNYHFPNDNTYYKLSSDIELSNNFIIDLKNQDDIKNISDTEILKYLKPFTVFERNNSFNSLEIIPSKFKSIKLEFEEQNYSIKKITGTYEKITYKVNNSWEKENIETTFVDKTILYFENFLLKFFDIHVKYKWFCPLSFKRDMLILY